ncbi:heavy metal translocating P-type ATPase [Haloimpatiens sp. FM7315]|uniref:heavy metal translocating P-type ATPase n=1 Tax=Haloimpatiens sp. FM7315 TaxID=3298609 RepID=UPI00370C4923
MEEVLVKEFILDGLHCANCASKIESKINSLEEVEEAIFVFSTSVLKVKLLNVEAIGSIEEKIKKIVKSYEPHVVVRKKNLKKNVSINNKNLGSSYKIHKKTIHNYEKSKTEYFEKAEQINHNESGIKGKDNIMVIVGSVIFVIGLFLKSPIQVNTAMYLISYILIGGDVILTALKNILRGELFDENFLMVIATVGAFAIGEYPEAVFVMLFYKVGEAFQDRAVMNSRKSIKDLMNIKPEMARIKKEDKLIEVSPDSVEVGDIILVKPGEKIPLDGIVIKGSSEVNTSDLTGESLPKNIKESEEVLGGFINITGVLIIKVNKVFSESQVSKILELVENAGAKKAPTEKFITKFARYYTPIVVFSALALAIIPPVITEGGDFKEWLKRALIFLVVSCPCALVISVPLGFFAGIGNASKKGILVKGGNYLEALNNVDTVVFDKTGTLTEGKFKVSSIKSKVKGNEDKVITLAAYGESYSNHPISKTIISYYGKEIDKSLIQNHKEILGQGIEVNIKSKEVFVGNERLMEVKKIKYHKPSEVGTVVYVAEEGEFLGYLVINDMEKIKAKSLIDKLKRRGIKTVMLTGDNKKVASYMADKLSLDEVYSELLPEDKVKVFEKIKNKKYKKGKSVFVGDGVNDAPVLASSDIGIAMGALGSDAAKESSDIVLMTDDLSKIDTVINISKFTRKVVVQNIVFALGIKMLVLILSALGFANMWEAAFADVGVALIAILNSMRVLRFKE